MVALVVALDLGGSILGWCDWSALLNVSGALDGCQDAPRSMSKAQYEGSPQPTAENNGHVLPPEEQMPDELPPTYEESLDRPGGSSTTRPVVPNRPPQNQTPDQNHLQVPQAPPRPSSSYSSNGAYGTANSSNTSFNTGNVSNSSFGSGKSGASGKGGRGHSPGPPGPHGRPPPSPGRPPHSPNRPPGQMGYGPRPQGGPAPNNPLLHYPRGYHCPKCDNTGIKKKNGKSCQDCWGMFARPNQQVVNIPGPQQQYTPFPFFPFTPPPPQQTTIYAAPGAPPPIVVQPGDPRLGGQVCGKCRGRGMVYDWFLGDETCPVCKGVGRVR
ncbi:hypothetical protein B0I72DRAFT_113438 [Yarrowia lipolytica]|uniref:YALI0D18062p n=1 Tax=Yarrowia lipolytica (strain CLIB 122 / E 150) TaxID=284591 RepID=Q6C8P4_YARLI|nr:YALI0D18062p [Yarrowia lipolytica CLIB122]RDW32085.1 hypothetical protein B0I72DRAFT_113438 [Yarrowia lipolytica]RDW37750.1 hypothetical protein B0I73DRAFT_122611 [Yarrowia lipolytica]RDW43552.1 hypothetical protein B0I74DRAFT_117667 [Yarrowia lipolytica]RDW50366.1 hypothetical protein B0I75DRAFT_123418 [Yarrowia lipolytica]CAG81160.1 YALI0D18062p [Yarrowia lipolytica CLIB122]|eukprot:XP_502968.1 YALI0D18062p [Yarrowia lipolytica CLIB122]